MHSLLLDYHDDGIFCQLKKNEYLSLCSSINAITNLNVVLPWVLPESLNFFCDHKPAEYQCCSVFQSWKLNALLNKIWSCLIMATRKIIPTTFTEWWLNMFDYIVQVDGRQPWLMRDGVGTLDIWKRETCSWKYVSLLHHSKKNR